MPFVLFLFFGALFLLICANDKAGRSAKARAYYKEYPEINRNEEVLLRLELYRKYRKDPDREDPIGDALEDAGWHMYNKGYRPIAVIKGGMSAWKNNPDRRRCDEELSKMNWKFPTIESLGGLCSPQYEQRWIALAEECAQELAAKEHWGPKATALEYIMACYIRQCILTLRRLAREDDCGARCPADAELLASCMAWCDVIDLGYTPSSWKMFRHSTFDEFRNRFTLCWPPEEHVVKMLLDADKAVWFDMKQTVKGSRESDPDVKRMMTFDLYSDYILRIYEMTKTLKMDDEVRKYSSGGKYWFLFYEREIRLRPHISPSSKHWTEELMAAHPWDFNNTFDHYKMEEFIWKLSRGGCCGQCHYAGEWK